LARRFEISSNHVYWVVVLALAACTWFFVSNVQQRRGELRADHSLKLESGTSVELVRVIDADEISVRDEAGNTFVVRLLGIKGFSTTINEPGISGLGQAAVTEIEKTVEDKHLRVVFEELKLDPRGRLLAYLEAEGADVGEQLVRSGRVVVYSRYPFSREAAYEGAEAEASGHKTGLWGNYKAVSRVQGWKDTWMSARKSEAAEAKEE
jgi:endonuclease YncB( thermonuclease family)